MIVERRNPAPAGGAARGALIRSVALPTEHGGWSFLLEPVVLGLLVAFSAAGLVLSVAVLGAFLVHQPLKTAIKDRLAGRRAFRTVWAERFAILYGAVAAGALVGAVWLGGWWPLAVMLAAAPFALVQLVWDAKNRSRALWPELSGALALAAVAGAVAAYGGWGAGAVAGLWLVMASRALPAIVYVRARLKLERGKPFSKAASLLAHLGAVAAVSAAAAAGAVPWLAAAAMALLLARSAHGLSTLRLASRPSMIGVQEIVLGLATVLLAAIGYWGA